MFSRFFFYGLLSLGLFALAETGFAMPIVFDFTGGGDNAKTISRTEGGVTIDITGARNNKNKTPALMVTWNDNGLGVKTNTNDDENTLDSFGPNERLIFSLAGGASAFRLDQIVFSGFKQKDEDFRLLLDDAQRLNNFTPENDTWNLAVDLPNDEDRTFTKNFIISVNDSDNSVAFRIRSFTVVSVPEPATLWITILGLLAMGLMRWRLNRI